MNRRLRDRARPDWPVIFAFVVLTVLTVVPVVLVVLLIWGLP